MKMTLLQMVQDILNSAESDAVNSIQDTVESLQVVQIIKTTYYEYVSRKDWPWLRGLITLTNSGSTSAPTSMTVPENVSRIEKHGVYYNKSTTTRKEFSKVRWMEPDEFLMKTNGRDNTNANTDVVTVEGASVLILNDVAPTFYTSFNDVQMIFDSYDSDVDTTLQASKFQVMGFTIPDWTETDTAIPDLPSEAFPTVLAEAKSVAMPLLKQEFDQKAEASAQRGYRRQSRNSWAIAGGMKRASYGRVSPKTFSPNPPFKDD